ncbi:uncharacterized protein LOC114745105 [Neltuma alba]|uniref:uncharacterized protein LOC114745105 n=1 Tax=Neltuma alba TaxID=207710 RepID=UPI0010A59253|nr:uncharacterized protein LOC114745105 [Prosopis alba]
MVEKTLDFFASTMKAVNEEGKNIVLLVAEKRKNKIYQILCENNEDPYRSAFSLVDKNGNTALHLAAKLGVNLNMQTTTMVEEFKWLELVKSSVPPELWEAPSNDGKRAEEIFRESFEQQMTRDREWVNQISEACSVVSTLVASMAFANVAVNFHKKNYSSLLALSLSLTPAISFLSILAFRSQSLYLWRYVPFRHHLAILTMFGSIVALWISLTLHDHSFKTYAIIGLPIALLTIFSLPTFIGPALTYMFTEIPIANRKTIGAIRSTKNLNPPH